MLARALQEMGLEVKEMCLGAVTLAGTARFESMEPIRWVLQENGFEWLAERDAEVISSIKRTVDELLTSGKNMICE